MDFYLSRVRFQTSDPDVRAMVADAQRLHAIIHKGFPWYIGSEPVRAAYGILYRLEPGGVLLVQSQVEPTWERMPKMWLRDVQAKHVHFELPVERHVQFRLRANVVRTEKREGRKNHVRVAIAEPRARREWMEARGGQAGLQITYLTMQPERIISGWGVTLTTILYNGVATITDPALLETAMTRGIGHSKAHGCGLLSLARVET